MTTVVRVDDRDPSITYKGSFILAGNPAYEYNGTTHGATSVGATITFSFNGTGITFYGTVGSPGPGTKPSTSSFALDDASALTVTMPLPDEAIYGHAYYVSPQLNDGEHTLVVTSVNATGADPIWFDYLEYVPSNVLSANSSSVSATSASLLPVSASASRSASSSPLTTTTTAASPVHKSSNLTTILPAVLIPVILFLFVLGALLLWWRRRLARFRGHYDGSIESSSVPVEARIVSPYLPVTVREPLLVAMPGGREGKMEHVIDLSAVQRADGSTTSGGESGDRTSKAETELPPPYVTV